MALDGTPKGLAWRERTGAEKRKIGLPRALEMLPTYMGDTDHPADGFFVPDLYYMATEDAYCDGWGRKDVISAKTRSLFTVAMMVTAGNTGNQFELMGHAPGLLNNGGTQAELEEVLSDAFIYGGGPAMARAWATVMGRLIELNMMQPGTPRVSDRREKTGSEKRKLGKEILAQLNPDSPLLDFPERLDEDTFAPELDCMYLENMYYDRWYKRDSVFDLKTRSIVVFGFLCGLHVEADIAEHVGVMLNCGVTVEEMEELIYQAASYLGLPTGKVCRNAVAGVLIAKGLKKK
jgi:alkylhydroperoxidase/carboxymuconolactone decarboxylase family protein YurZ